MNTTIMSTIKRGRDFLEIEDELPDGMDDAIAIASAESNSDTGPT
jgi:hypothetical protein